MVLIIRLLSRRNKITLRTGYYLAHVFISISVFSPVLFSHELLFYNFPHKDEASCVQSINEYRIDLCRSYFRMITEECRGNHCLGNFHEPVAVLKAFQRSRYDNVNHFFSFRVDVALLTRPTYGSFMTLRYRPGFLIKVASEFSSIVWDDEYSSIYQLLFVRDDRSLIGYAHHNLFFYDSLTEVSELNMAKPISGHMTARWGVYTTTLTCPFREKSVDRKGDVDRDSRADIKVVCTFLKSEEIDDLAGPSIRTGFFYNQYKTDFSVTIPVCR